MGERGRRVEVADTFGREKQEEKEDIKRLKQAVEWVRVPSWTGGLGQNSGASETYPSVSYEKAAVD